MKKTHQWLGWVLAGALMAVPVTLKAQEQKDIVDTAVAAGSLLRLWPKPLLLLAWLIP